MSARSMIRESRRRERRNRRRAGVAAAAALGAVALGPSPASANDFEVNSLVDPGDGTCSATCTLRDAVDDANANGGTPDTITFKSGLSGTIRLTPNNEIYIGYPTKIVGPGEDKLTISGDSNSDGHVNSGDSGIFRSYLTTDVSISGMTLTGGAGAGGSRGGAIYATYVEHLTLDHVTITNGGADGGGATYTNHVGLTVTNSTFSGNLGSVGGTIDAYDTPHVSSYPSSLVVRNSTFENNRSSVGGGILIQDVPDFTIENTTISGNAATNGGAGGGGGLYVQDDATGVIRNSTISGNLSAFTGGGIQTHGLQGKLTIENSTIAGNVSAEVGGGIDNWDASQSLVMKSSIVASNKPNDLSSENASVSMTPTFSLIGNPGNAPLIVSTTNKLGVDPQLGPLADNGGPTKTMLPAASSPALDAGVADGLTTDQRGLARTFESPPANAAGSDGTDIGAVEYADTSVDSPSASAKRKQRAKGGKVKVVVEAGAGEAVTVEATGTIKLKGGKGGKGGKTKRAKAKSVLLRGGPVDAAAGERGKLTLTPAKRSDGRKLAKALKGRKLKVAIEVTLTDGSGNSVSEPLKVTLSGSKRKKPK